MNELQFEHILSKEYNGGTSNFIKIGNANIMFDGGIDDMADPKVLSSYDAYMDKVDIILLTHATFRHCGALPYLKRKYDFSKISVYATFPVNKLASAGMYEYYGAHKQMGNFELFTIEDINNAFIDVNPVNFQQTKTLNINETEFTITALNAGYSLGGAIWRITYLVHKLIYAIDVNDKNESITEPLRMNELRDSHYLITNTYIAPSIDGKVKSSKIRPQLSRERLRYHISKTLLENVKFNLVNTSNSEQQMKGMDENIPSSIEGLPIGEVLMRYNLTSTNSPSSSRYPCAGQYDAEMLLVGDNFSRVLEVLLYLEDLADQVTDLQKIPILYLEHLSKESLEIASSHIEWMNNRLKSTFADIDTNPMNFKYIEKLSSEDELQKYQNPRIVITTTNTFLLGHSGNLLPKVLKNKKSQLIFINKQLSHPLGPALIKNDMTVHTHK